VESAVNICRRNPADLNTVRSAIRKLKEVTEKVSGCTPEAYKKEIDKIIIDFTL
jgi:hypothetical protein